MKYDKDFNLKFISSNSSFISIESRDTISSVNDSINKAKYIFPLEVKAYNEDTVNYHHIKVYNHIDTINEIGKLKIACNKVENRKISFIYVLHDSTSNSTNIDTTTILNFLNQKAYNQSFIEWKTYGKKTGSTVYVKKVDILDFKSEYALIKPRIDTLTNEDLISNILTQKITDAYLLKINRPQYWSDTHYLIITDIPFNTGSQNIRGYTTTLEQGDLSFVFLNNNTNDYLTNDVHELAHQLTLWHTFKDKDSTPRGWWLSEGTTNNYMDYNNTKKSFYFFQWQKMNSTKFPNP